MAKISLTKLGVNKPDIATISVVFNNIEIEIISYLSIKEKMNMINNLVSVLMERNENFYNPAEVETAKIILLIEHYTNISYSDAEKKDEGKLFDKLMSSGLANVILKNIPAEELQFFDMLLYNSLNNVYAYTNSIAGVVERIYQSYGDSQEELLQLRESIDKLEYGETIKEILSNNTGKNVKQN